MTERITTLPPRGWNTARTPEQIADLLISLPPIYWSATMGELTMDQKMEVEGILSRRAIALVRVAAYLSRLTTGGKHQDAVKAQNKAARSTRQALGYTYADDKISF